MRKTTRKIDQKRARTARKFRWCVNEGWGNTDGATWHVARSIGAAMRGISKEARRVDPKRFNNVWCETETEEGLVVDFGSHWWFGFVEGAKLMDFKAYRDSVSRPDGAGAGTEADVHACMLALERAGVHAGDIAQTRSHA